MQPTVRYRCFSKPPPQRPEAVARKKTTAAGDSTHGYGSKHSAPGEDGQAPETKSNMDNDNDDGYGNAKKSFESLIPLEIGPCCKLTLNPGTVVAV